MTDVPAGVVAMVYVTTAACLLLVGVPQAWEFLARGWARDDLQAFRLKTMLVCCGFSALLLWRAAVMLDFALYQQHYLGTIGERSLVELVLALVLQAGALYTLILYWRTRSRP